MKLSDAVVEGVKELVRTALIAVVPVVLLQLQSNQFDLKVIGIALAVAVLSGVDKWLHVNDVKSPLDLTSLDVLKK